MLPAGHHLSLLALALVPLASLAGAAAAGAGEGFCSAEPSSDCSQGPPLYWKVTNPTLSPVHLQGIPTSLHGRTRTRRLISCVGWLADFRMSVAVRNAVVIF
jgi:hypothetical protein